MFDIVNKVMKVRTVKHNNIGLLTLSYTRNLCRSVTYSSTCVLYVERFEMEERMKKTFYEGAGKAVPT